jgi:hypothetical protein
VPGAIHGNDIIGLYSLRVARVSLDVVFEIP